MRRSSVYRLFGGLLALLAAFVVYSYFFVTQPSIDHHERLFLTEWGSVPFEVYDEYDLYYSLSGDISDRYMKVVNSAGQVVTFVSESGNKLKPLYFYTSENVWNYDVSGRDRGADLDADILDVYFPGLDDYIEKFDPTSFTRVVLQ